MRASSLVILGLVAPLALSACASRPAPLTPATTLASYGAASGESVYEAHGYQAGAVTYASPRPGAEPPVPPVRVGYRGEGEGLLSEPPADAHAGECFAKVVVPGQPVYGPPQMQPHLKWVQRPPQPGTIGPVWCQVWEAGYQPSVHYTPEQYGWIRVICDKDATREKIEHIQHRLHDWGVYNGATDGQYGQSTADAVARFQQSQKIEHGGYLSYGTMTALEAQPPAPQYASQYAPQYAPQPLPVVRTVIQPVVQTIMAAPYGQAACGPQPCRMPVPSPCAQQSPCAAQPGVDGRRRYLTWAGKVEK